MKKLNIKSIDAEIESKRAELAKLKSEYDEVMNMQSGEIKINNFCHTGFNPAGFDIQTSMQELMASKTYALSTINKEIAKVEKQIEKLEEKYDELHSVNVFTK